jgi:hypothetical protein
MILLGGASVSHAAAVILNRADVGTTISVDYAGTVLGLPNSGLGAISSFVYTGASTDGRTYNFSYALNNDSTTSSRIRSFGFDVLGSTALTGTSSSGTYSTAYQNPLSALIGTDLCFSTSGLGTCTTGSGGLTAGQSTTGTFALTFAQSVNALQLDDFTVNFQAVGGLLAGTGKGDATVMVPVTQETVSTAPESSTWAMMILGFGLTGWLLRRRTATASLALQG